MLSTLEENRVVLVPQGKQPIQNPMPANKRAGLSISKFDANVNTGRFPRSDTFIKTKGDFFSPFDQPVEGFYPPSSDDNYEDIFQSVGHIGEILDGVAKLVKAYSGVACNSLFEAEGNAEIGDDLSGAVIPDDMLAQLYPRF